MCMCEHGSLKTLLTLHNAHATHLAGKSVGTALIIVGMIVGTVVGNKVLVGNCSTRMCVACELHVVA